MSKLGAVFDKRQTFRPKFKHARGSKRYDLHKFARNTFLSGSVVESVRLPEGEDLSEWLAANTVDAVNEVNLLYGNLAGHCTAETCPRMTAGSKYEFRWEAAEGRPAVSLPAPEYVYFLMTWIEARINDDAVFVTDEAQAFPPEFLPTVQTIFKRLFRVYAHMYHSHFEAALAMGVEVQLMLAFKRFVCFVLEFDLVQPNYLKPMQQLVFDIAAQGGYAYATPVDTRPAAHQPLRAVGAGAQPAAAAEAPAGEAEAPAGEAEVESETQTQTHTETQAETHTETQAQTAEAGAEVEVGAPVMPPAAPAPAAEAVARTRTGSRARGRGEDKGECLLL